MHAADVERAPVMLASLAVLGASCSLGHAAVWGGVRRACGVPAGRRRRATIWWTAEPRPNLCAVLS